MQNIDVRFNASSNFSKVKADLTSVRAEAAALNATLQHAYAKPPELVNTTKWAEGSRAVHEASNSFRAAASSSGLFTTQQIRATSQSEKFTKALQKQKLSLADMRKHSGIMREVYRDQLRNQRMQTVDWGTDSAGRQITDVVVPKNVPRDLDTAAQKLYFMGQMANSASTNIVNMGKNFQWAGRQLTVGLTYPVALFGAAAGVMAYKVDEALTKVTKVYDVSAAAMGNETLRAKELADVRVRSMELAKKSAREYGMAITDTLEIEQRLAATGLSGDTLMSATKEVSRIAVLGDLEIGASTDMAVALQTAFKDTIKTSEDLTDTFNYMNAVENATSLSLADIAEATPRAASGLAQLGVNAEQMTVMLVAMREAGVNAAEGANALKSATTRILNPAIVEAAAKRYADAGANIDVQGIVDRSGGNLFEFLKGLGQATAAHKDLTAQQKASAVAALFGTYQFNRLNAALVNVGDAYDVNAKGANQTSKAVELMNANTKDLAKTAEQEMAEKMEAVSGRFKAAWESMRAELSEMGIPFLKVATYVAELAGSVIKFFNGMSEAKKTAAMWAVASAAIIGPLVMMGGLFMNLGGQFIKGTGKIMTGVGRLGGAFGLLARDEQAANLSTKNVSDSMAVAGQRTATLAQEISVLTAAYEKATAAAQRHAMQTGAIAKPTGPVAGPVARPQTWTPTTPQQQFVGMPAGLSTAHMTTPIKKTAGAYEHAARRAENLSRIERDRLHTQMLNNQKAAAEKQIRTGIESKITSANLGMTAMGVGASMMMLPLGSASNEIGKWLMIGSVVVPAVIAMANTMGVAAKSAWATAAGTMATAKAARLAAAANGAATMGIGARLAGGAAGAAAGIAGLMTPIGWVVAGVAAIGAGWYFVNRNIKKSREEQEKMLAETDKGRVAVLNLTERWAEATGKAYHNYKKYNQEGAVDQTRQEQMTYAEQVRKYTLPNKEGGAADELKSYNDMDDADKRRADLLKMTQLIKNHRMTDKEQRLELTAFFDAAGNSATEARIKANELFDAYKKNGVDWNGLYEEMSAPLMDGSLLGQPESIEKYGTEAGTFWAIGFKKSTTADALAAMEQLKTDVMDKWKGVYDDASTNYVDVKANWHIVRGTNPTDEMRAEWAAEFKNIYGDIEQFRADQISLSAEEFRKKWEGAFQGNGPKMEAFEKAAKDAEAVERAMVGASAAQLGMGDEIDTLQDFANEAAILAKTLTSTAQGEQAVAWMNELKDVKAQLADSDMTDPEEVERLEALRTKLIASLSVLNNFGDVKFTDPEDAKAFMKLLVDAGLVADKAKEAKDEIEKLPDDKRIKVSINRTEAVDIVKNSMAAVQARMAESAMDKFEAGWDGTIEAVEARHESATEAMERRHEKAQEAFDERWKNRKEAVERAYDRRAKAIENEIEREEKADERRQRLFEKEKDRLAKLAELANTDIDFNKAVNEGNLDEAAKIMNNAGVSEGNAQMDSELAAAEKKTADRREVLESKNDRLEKQREKELEALEKMEKRMRKHLERTQKLRSDTLAKEQKQYMKNLDKRRDAEKRLLEQKLDLFKAFVPKNKKQLDRWISKIGESYDTFGGNVMEGGESWATSIGKSMRKEVRIAGAAVASDKMWKKTSKEMADKLIEGWGFGSMKELRRFVRTGQMGDGKKGKGGIGDIDIRHEGGVIGSGKGSRKGVAPTYKGMHRSERLVLAQNDEFMVNREASRKHRPLLEAINKGGDVPLDGVQGGGTGPVGMMAGIASRMFNAGMEQALGNAYGNGLAKQAAQMAKSGSFLGQSGEYGGRRFSSEQMKNAAIIASTGAGMGMSERDIQIGIMTAIAESGLINVNHGDRDSLGLFQQRPSMGWGSAKQVTDPNYSSAKFFSALKGQENRDEMSPWAAAQAVQRSAFADGSNYRAWWAAASQIFKQGLESTGGIDGGFVVGKGGKHRPINNPVTSGLHGGRTAGNPPAVDFATGTGVHKPVYAIADGVITASRDIRGPLSTDRYKGTGPYGSFGRMIQMRTDSGESALYAHLSRRSVAEGQRVKGGSTIGYSGNTGNSSGDHLHFGATNGPYAWLRKGGEIKYDNTHVVAHRGETMLSAPVTRQLKENIASGGGEGYNVIIDLRGAYIKEDVDIEKAVNTAIDRREAKTGRKRVVR